MQSDRPSSAVANKLGANGRKLAELAKPTASRVTRCSRFLLDNHCFTCIVNEDYLLASCAIASLACKRDGKTLRRPLPLAGAAFISNNILQAPTADCVSDVPCRHPGENMFMKTPDCCVSRTHAWRPTVSIALFRRLWSAEFATSVATAVAKVTGSRWAFHSKLCELLQMY